MKRKKIYASCYFNDDTVGRRGEGQDSTSRWYRSREKKNVIVRRAAIAPSKELLYIYIYILKVRTAVIFLHDIYEKGLFLNPLCIKINEHRFTVFFFFFFYNLDLIVQIAYTLWVYDIELDYNQTVNEKYSLTLHVPSENDRVSQGSEITIE